MWDYTGILLTRRWIYAIQQLSIATEAPVKTRACLRLVGLPDRMFDLTFRMITPMFPQYPSPREQS